jgi:hypothetical protein
MELYGEVSSLWYLVSGHVLTGVFPNLVPTRYGRAVAQISALFDATGGLWATGYLTSTLFPILQSLMLLSTQCTEA